MADVRHVVLVGAARSGTKILRDSLATSLGVGAVPYDINFVWRYRNEDYRHDLLQPEDLDRKAAAFIRRYLAKYAGNGVVVEKTVSNALRVPYVAEALPDAHFIHLIRDGLDVTQSTHRQWLTPPEGGYVRDKLRHFPPRLAFGYGRKYLTRTLQQRAGRAEHGSWGVRYLGIDDDLATQPLVSICARQWVACVEAASEAFSSGRYQVTEVRYEDLVSTPQEVLAGVAEELRIPPVAGGLSSAAAKISGSSVGSGLLRMSADELEIVADELDPVLARNGYRTVRERLG